LSDREVSRQNLVFPPKGSDSTKLRAYVDAACDQKSSYRTDLYREWGLSKNMFESNQWVRIDARRDARNAFRWTSQDPADDIPKPVHNKILELVDNEVGKTSRRQSRPYVRPRTGGSEAKRGGTRLGNEVLNWHLEKIHWGRVRHEGIWKNTVYGVGIWLSVWDLDWRKTVRVGLPDAVKCSDPSCNFKLASTKLPPEALKGLPPEHRNRVQLSASMENGQSTITGEAKACLQCPESKPLTSAKLLPNEIEGSDTYGRPLAKDVPLGDGNIELISPEYFFPENEGIGIDPRNMTSFVINKPESLDYIASHYDVTVDEEGRVFKGTEEIKAEDPATIAEYLMTLGDTNFYSAGVKEALSARNVYRRHVRLRRAFQMPTRQYPLGRMVHIANNVVLVDDDMMSPCKHKKGEFYPRVKAGVARFWPRDGEFFSQGMIVPLISPQNRLNMAFSQITDNRERNGTDGLIITKGMRLLSPNWLKNFSGRVAVWDMDPEAPNMVPQPLPSRMIDSRIYEETDRIETHMRSLTGQQDVDVGKAAPGIKAARAIQLLQEKSSERRDQRNQELDECFQDLFSHQLVLLSEKVIEPRTYETQGPGKSWEIKEFTGLDLAGLTDVRVDVEASFSDQLYEAQAVEEALDKGLIPIDTPVAKREVAKVLRIPQTLMDESNVQIDDAERKWFRFKQEHKVPNLDESLDNHVIFWQVYGKALKSEDGQECIERAKWEDLLPLLAGWEEKLAMAEQADQMARTLPGLMAQAEQSGMPAQQQIPPEQLEEMLLPADLPSKILIVWLKSLASQGVKVQEHEEPKDGMAPPVNENGEETGPPSYQLNFLRFRATAEAHRLYAQGRPTGAPTPMGPQAAAPMGPATSPTMAGPMPAGPGAMPGPM
jgi:hypothetical protein